MGCMYHMKLVERHADNFESSIYKPNLCLSQQLQLLRCVDQTSSSTSVFSPFVPRCDLAFARLLSQFHQHYRFILVLIARGTCLIEVPFSLYAWTTRSWQNGMWTSLKVASMNHGKQHFKIHVKKRAIEVGRHIMVTVTQYYGIKQDHGLSEK